MPDFTFRDIAKMFDHSLLQPNLTDAEMEAGLQVARAYDVASVCIKPYYVRRAAEVLTGSGVKVCTVIGFPHGSHRTHRLGHRTNLQARCSRSVRPVQAPATSHDSSHLRFVGRRDTQLG